MIKAIFWDNDGILVDTEQLYLLATQEIMTSAGIPLTEAEYIELFLVQGRGAWHLAAERGVPADEIERLRLARNTLYGEWLAERPILIDGIRDVLEALHGRYAMGVVTSSRKDHFDVIHRRTDLLKYFDFVLTAEDVSRVKPDPELYRKAVDVSGVQPDACVAVEDSARGLLAAKGAGIHCVVIPTRLTHSCAFPGADAILTAAGELPAALEALSHPQAEPSGRRR